MSKREITTAKALGILVEAEIKLAAAIREKRAATTEQAAVDAAREAYHQACVAEGCHTPIFQLV